MAKVKILYIGEPSGVLVTLLNSPVLFDVTVTNNGYSGSFLFRCPEEEYHVLIINSILLGMSWQDCLTEMYKGGYMKRVPTLLIDSSFILSVLEARRFRLSDVVKSQITKKDLFHKLEFTLKAAEASLSKRSIRIITPVNQKSTNVVLEYVTNRIKSIRVFLFLKMSSSKKKYLKFFFKDSLENRESKSITNKVSNSSKIEDSILHEYCEHHYLLSLKGNNKRNSIKAKWKAKFNAFICPQDLINVDEVKFLTTDYEVSEVLQKMGLRYIERF